MKLFALLGALALLILPFAVISTTINDSALSDSQYGLLYYKTHNDVFDSTTTESFQGDWIQDNGVYESYFADGYQLAIVVLLMVVVALAFAVFTSKDNMVAGILIIVSSLLLIYLRFQVLSDSDLGFYSKTENFLGTYTYSELPIGPVVGLILGIVDLSKRKN